MEILILIIAFLLDYTLSEPPLIVHPVYWFGKIVNFFETVRLRFSPGIDFLLGILAVFSVIFFALLIVKISEMLPFPLLWQSYLLFSSISIKSMILHAKACVDKGKVSAEGVQKIVSRDTSSLSEPQLCSATIESIAENFVDGVFAPLFYFSIFGLPGAVIYRAVNVCDAMVGYRNEKYEFFGKFAAKLDDVLNYVPARLSLLLFEFFKSGAIRYGIEKNVKLNGCAIAAMSYILGVRLEKPGYYSLEGKNPDVSDVMMAIEYFKKLSILAVLTALMITSIRLLLLT